MRSKSSPTDFDQSVLTVIAEKKKICWTKILVPLRNADNVMVAWVDSESIVSHFVERLELFALN